MDISRRRFVTATGSTALFLESAMAAGDEAVLNCLAAWVDTLYPDDDLCPAASDLGVVEEIVEKAGTVHNYTELLRRGTVWADAQAVTLGAKSFADLEEAGREKVVTAAAAMEETSVPGMFFFHTLRDGAHFYYGNGETWAAVGFPHPPQPLGFATFSQSPAE